MSDWPKELAKRIYDLVIHHDPSNPADVDGALESIELMLRWNGIGESVQGATLRQLHAREDGRNE